MEFETTMSIPNTLFNALQKKKILNPSYRVLSKLQKRYIIDKDNILQTSNIVQLLKSKLCTFQELVEALRQDFDLSVVFENALHSKKPNKKPFYDGLEIFLEDFQCFQKLFDENLISSEDLQHLWKSIQTSYQFKSLTTNLPLIKQLFDRNVVSFKSFNKKLHTIQDESFSSVVRSDVLHKLLIKNNIVSNAAFRRFFNSLRQYEEFGELSNSSYLVHHLIDSQCITYREFLDRYKKHSEFSRALLCSDEHIDEWMSKSLIDVADLQYAIESIEDYSDLSALLFTTSLNAHLLSEFAFTQKQIDSFNKILDEKSYAVDEIKMTFFDFICSENKNNLELKKNAQINSYVLSDNFSKDEKKQLIELLKNDNLAKDRLNSILENHFESNYVFDSLMNYLKKHEKRNLINI